MFTGLIQEVGLVEAVSPRGGGLQLAVAAPRIGPQCSTGESIAVNGACLTVERPGQRGFVCFAGSETIRRTTVGELVPRAPVNLERALAVGDRMGGHFVQGHVDCVGILVGRAAEGETILLEFELPQEYLPYVAPKGSIAVDGISLTVTEVTERGFGVAIIPHTLANTTLAGARVGQRVNIETDIIAKYVARLTGVRVSGGLTREFLAEHGFM